MCSPYMIEFDPLMANKDIDWEITNSVCIAYVAAAGATLLGVQTYADYACLQPQLAAAEAASFASGVPLSPATVVANAQKAAACSSLISSQLYSQAAACCGGVAANTAAIGVAVGALASIYDAAKKTYKYGRVCGHDWMVWKKIDDEGNESSTGTWSKGAYSGSYKKCLDDLFLNNNNSCGLCYSASNATIFSCDSTTAGTRNITNQFYRELIYGGKEFEDNSDDACKNPSTWGSSKRKEILGYDSDKQRYYMTGPGLAPSYACHRFYTQSTDAVDFKATQAAFECCKRKSQSAICIENVTGTAEMSGGYEHKFCQIGSRCEVGDIWFDVYASLKQVNYVCAKTYSVCPYNHLLGGGTETQKFNSANQMQVDNFCQFMNHCSKLPITPYIRTSSLEGGYISSACKDMKGDSQNVYGYTAQLIPINTRGFSAPMVQCFKETMENILLNKAGDTKCLDPTETPINDVCTSGYIYQKGVSPSEQSFFIKIQDAVQDVIKIGLSISVIALGASILLGVPKAMVDKKLLLTYIVKIGLVMYFAVGDGWQQIFMTSVLDTSSYLSEMTLRIDENRDQSHLDGCQFPKFNYADSNDYSTAQYPPGKEYLRVWDTFDCKIAMALGFGPSVTVPNLALMILGGFLTGGLGIIFFVAAFLFAFFLIALTVRAIHIFLLSTVAVVILMYVAPITITLAMFERTKNIFNGWWKQMLGFTLQPMILFAYIGILITLFNSVIIGEDVTFKGDRITAPKQIVCNEVANDNSIYCIFNVSDIKTWNGFEVLGIGLPMLGHMNQAKLQAIIKAALLMFVFMKFMDHITKFASELVGGAELQSNWSLSASGMAKRFSESLRSIQERGMNVTKKYGMKAMRAGGEAFSNAARTLGNRGRSIADANVEKGTDNIAQSGRADIITQSKPEEEKKKKEEEKKDSKADHITSS